MANWLQKQWVGFSFWHILLIPLSWIFCAITSLRRWLYKHGWLNSYHLGVPVIVVGNINVGGTGKTPLVIWLAEQLLLAGYKPGIISRGYAGSAKQVMEVLESSRPGEVGDEPVLLAMRTACPVFVGANRVETGQALLKTYPECNVIISDDGLQHYRLQRDVEIVVFDSIKGFGNRALLPAGPLREKQSRLKTVDAIVSNGRMDGEGWQGRLPIEMRLEPTSFYNLIDNQIKADVQFFTHQKVLAVAGIGNPERFFQQLRLMGLDFQGRAYPDHYEFKTRDFDGLEADIVVMTEKDAVKCRPFAQPNFWVLLVSAVINNDLLIIILNKLNKLRT